MDWQVMSVAEARRRREEMVSRDPKAGGLTSLLEAPEGWWVVMGHLRADGTFGCGTIAHGFATHEEGARRMAGWMRLGIDAMRAVHAVERWWEAD